MKNIKSFNNYRLNESEEDFDMNIPYSDENIEDSIQKPNISVNKELTAKKFLFDKYSKYFPMAKSFEYIEQNVLTLKRISKLMEEYHILKTK